MNINPTVKRILCYGDSNTYGQVPITKERYASDVRWTGQLQRILGPDFEILEEGLGSRTTRLEYADKQGRNGESYLLPCLESQNPLDVIVLFLGTNDLKEVFHQKPVDIAASIQHLIQIVKTVSWNAQKKQPHILLVSPAIVDESVESTREKYVGAEAKSKALAPLYQEVAAKEGCSFINLAEYIVPSKQDGLHFDQEAHAIIAKVISEKVLRIFVKVS